MSRFSQGRSHLNGTPCLNHSTSLCANPIVTLIGVALFSGCSYVDPDDSVTTTAAAVASLDASVTTMADSGAECSLPQVQEIHAETQGIRGGVSGGTNTAGREVVYTFTVESPTELFVEVAPNTRASVGAFLRKDNCDEGSEVRYARTPSHRIRVTLDPGRYFLIVDAVGRYGGGGYWLWLEFDKLGRCDALSRVSPIEPATQSITGTLPARQSALAPAQCDPGTAPGAGPERAYTFTVDSTVDLTAQVAGVDRSLDTVLYLRKDDCGADSAEVSCDNDGGPGFGSRLSATLDPGRYFLIVDAQPGDAGRDYELTLSFGDPSGVCRLSNVIEIEAISQELRGVLESRSQTWSPRCGDDNVDDSSGEQIYTFTVHSPARLRATMQGAQSPWIDTLLYLRRDACDVEGWELACDHGTGGVFYSSHINEPLRPGRYYLVADGHHRGVSGGYVIDLEITHDSQSVDHPIGEIDDFVADQPNRKWQRRRLWDSYRSPVIVTQALSSNGLQPSHVRVRSADSNESTPKRAFEWKIEEWAYLDGRHIEETISYMAMKEGVHTLRSGAPVEARNTAVTHEWVQVEFVQVFAEAPAVFAGVSSANQALPVVPRVRAITPRGFQLRLQAEEAAGAREIAETVSWIAMSQRTRANGLSRLTVQRTGRVHDHKWRRIDFPHPFPRAPTVMANIDSFHGSDTASVRFRNIDTTSFEIRVEEEMSRDTETAHTRESISWLATHYGTFYSSR